MIQPDSLKRWAAVLVTVDVLGLAVDSMWARRGRPAHARSLAQAASAANAMLAPPP